MSCSWAVTNRWFVMLIAQLQRLQWLKYHKNGWLSVWCESKALLLSWFVEVNLNWHSYDAEVIQLLQNWYQIMVSGLDQCCLSWWDKVVWSLIWLVVVRYLYFILGTTVTSTRKPITLYKYHSSQHTVSLYTCILIEPPGYIQGNAVCMFGKYMYLKKWVSGKEKTRKEAVPKKHGWTTALHSYISI